ncbi:MAG: hypothetical protein JKY86_03405 [Gammaproteobacteria bacterium]|nr:hypothetical protein [Gammaproteobacteria bacterium]
MVNTKSPGGIAFRETVKDFGYEDFWKAIDAAEDPNIRLPEYNLAKFGQEKADVCDKK